MSNFNSITKAVILAAGEGKRLLPITSTRPKHLISLAGKPLIQYTIEYLKQKGVQEILFIVGYLQDKIRDYFGDGSNFGLKITYTVQKEYLGTANAASLGKDFTKNDPFFLIYGDLLLDERIFTKSIQNFLSSKAQGLICLFTVPDPSKYGIIALDEHNYVKTIIEKPEGDEYGNLANAGVYIFGPEIYKAIENTQLSARQEYEFTDSMQILIDSGSKIIGCDISGFYWSDVGHPWQVLDANTHLLNSIPNDINGIVEDHVTIKGNVIIGKNSIIKSGTYIEGPVFIGENTTVGPNSYIRPYASIGNNCRVGNSSEIKNSILFEKTCVSHLSYIGDSVIGENVNFGAGSIISNVRLDKSEIYMNIKNRRVSTGRKKMGAVIGDNVQLGINSMIMVGKKIGTGAIVGAGTIVTDDIPDDSLYYSKPEKIQKKIEKPTIE